MATLDGQQLDRDSPVPLWFQIAELLRKSIESGEVEAGDRLDNEIELSEKLGVSRPTMRQAIQALVQKDLLVRRRGVGTVVANRRIKRPVALTSLHDDLTATGRKPSTKVLAMEEVPSEPEVARELGIEPGDPVLRLQRLRLADGLPLAIMDNTVPVKVLSSALLADDLERAGLYELLRAQGVRFHSAHETIAARTATAREARLFEASRNATVLTMARTAYDPAGTVIEFGQHSYLASRYSFEINLYLK